MISGHHSTPESAAEAPPAATGNATRSHEPGSSARRGSEPMSPEQRAVLVEHAALSSPLRTSRFMSMMAALDQVRPETWQGMWEEFKRQTSEDGRVHEVEWSLFMNRVGEIDGAAAMEFFEKNGQPEYTFNRREILFGWAAADPQAAVRWMDSQPPNSPNQELKQTLMSGIVQSDPDMAISLLSKTSGNAGVKMAQTMVDDLIQAKGIDWTMDRIVSMRDTSPVYSQIMSGQIDQRVKRMAWLAGDEAAINKWRMKSGMVETDGR